GVDRRSQRGAQLRLTSPRDVLRRELSAGLWPLASMSMPPLIWLAAGGTGGHLFPAEALGVTLLKRGLRVRLVTDARALRYSGLFSKEMIDVVASETARGRSPLALARTGVMLAAGTVAAFSLMRRLRPSAV